MRFLLSTTTRVNQRLTATAAPFAARDSNNPDAIVASKSFDIPNHCQKKFGQQCGHYCGCVVRLEVTIDPLRDNTVVSTKYSAKQIVLISTHREGKRIPLRTTKGRLQFTKSRCPTLQKLLPFTMDFIQGKPLARLQSYTDFSGHRSSESFRDVVLEQHGVKASCWTGACFDLVEDVVTATIRGHIPAPRRFQQPHLFIEDVIEDDFDISSYPLEPFESVSVLPMRDVVADWTTSLVWHFSKNTISNQVVDGGMKRPRKWTALDWMDWTTEQEKVKQPEVEEEKIIRDWLSYVDLYQCEQSA